MALVRPREDTCDPASPIHLEGELCFNMEDTPDAKRPADAASLLRKGIDPFAKSPECGKAFQTTPLNAGSAKAAAAAATRDDSSTLLEDTQETQDPKAATTDSGEKDIEFVYTGLLTTIKNMLEILEMLGVDDKQMAKQIIYYSRSFMYYYKMLNAEYKLCFRQHITSVTHYKNHESFYGKPMIHSLSKLYKLENAAANNGKVIIFCPTESVIYINTVRSIFEKSGLQDYYITLYATDGTNKAVKAYCQDLDFLLSSDLLASL